jgi:predicted DNA-binding transcriptional regulator AlpA
VKGSARSVALHDLAAGKRRGAFPVHRRISASAVARVEIEVNGWIQSKLDSIKD